MAVSTVQHFGHSDPPDVFTVTPANDVWLNKKTTKFKKKKKV